MISALVLGMFAGLFIMSMRRLLRPALPARSPDAGGGAPDDAAPGDDGGGYPESMTAELDPGDEEYLAWLADSLWPEDEYLDPDHADDEEGPGSSVHA
ncbi:hypothetical protein [Actinomadura rudentiformis]|uniref:Uncharacterized protein n=1 Tax=Actinomadura rudentiformis TaxID=359158 RepID=A0A6H9YEA4_9ACTN|nr:hypothetical protein [Actinomadura rudentiformis]KAB2339639.1 hypothetical protein F8566_47365 [Actinomadura rudentiformis]